MTTAHTPTLLDASSDLLRCIYCISSDTESISFLHFFKNAENIIKKNGYLLNVNRLKHIEEQLKLASNKNLSKTKRQEHLLLVSTLLM